MLQQSDYVQASSLAFCETVGLDSFNAAINRADLSLQPVLKDLRTLYTEEYRRIFRKQIEGNGKGEMLENWYQ